MCGDYSGHSLAAKCPFLNHVELTTIEHSQPNPPRNEGSSNSAVQLGMVVVVVVVVAVGFVVATSTLGHILCVYFTHSHFTSFHSEHVCGQYVVLGLCMRVPHSDMKQVLCLI